MRVKTPNEKIRDANEQTSKAQADLMLAAADAKYKVAMEQATSDHDIAVKQCEALAGDQQKACKDRASADLAAAQARADEAHSQHTPAQY